MISPKRIHLDNNYHRHMTASFVLPWNFDNTNLPSDLLNSKIVKVVIFIAPPCTLAQATRLRTHIRTNSSLSLSFSLSLLAASFFPQPPPCAARSSLEPAVSCVTPRCADEIALSSRVSTVVLLLQCDVRVLSKARGPVITDVWQLQLLLLLPPLPPPMKKTAGGSLIVTWRWTNTLLRTTRESLATARTRVLGRNESEYKQHSFCLRTHFAVTFCVWPKNERRRVRKRILRVLHWKKDTRKFICETWSFFLWNKACFCEKWTSLISEIKFLAFLFSVRCLESCFWLVLG